MDESGRVPWTDRQWSQVSQVITDEATKARVAASVLPILSSVPPSTEVVPRERIQNDGTVDDISTIHLIELSVDVKLSRQQVEEPDLGSALLLFRWAANLVARSEDWVTFNGRPSAASKAAFMALEGDPNPPPRHCLIRGGRFGVEGLLSQEPERRYTITEHAVKTGEKLVPVIVEATSVLEERGYLAPFSVVLGNRLFELAYTPANGSLVLPRDRIEPFVGGQLLRSGAIDKTSGVVVSLAGEPVDLVVAVDASPQFLYVDNQARYVFRVFERFAPRIKDPAAVVQLIEK
jgi:uncharacterized linocin/CFP29 family protein